MENFDVVQALARTALGGSRSAVLQQIDRLAARLSEAGDDRNARTLRSMVTRAQKTRAVEPLEFVRSSTAGVEAGQARLGLRTALPTDRDTGAPLCEVVFPDQARIGPTLESGPQESLRALIREWNHRESLEDAGLGVSQSLLLYGPPGTGKTTLALLLATLLDLPAVVARLDGLVSSLLGTTARNLGALFEFCNRYQTVLILDEFDAVAKIRDDPNEVGEIKRVVNTLLQNLDKRAPLGLTIAITNHEQLLDTAIWRRFEHQVQLGLPKFELRTTIAQRYLASAEGSEALSRVIAWATEGRSGADVRALCLAWMKAWVLTQGEAPTPIDLLRSAARSVGGATRVPLLAVLEGPDPDLAHDLHSAPASVTGSDLGRLFGRDRRTIGRWLDADVEARGEVTRA